MRNWHRRITFSIISPIERADWQNFDVIVLAEGAGNVEIYEKVEGSFTLDMNGLFTADLSSWLRFKYVEYYVVESEEGETHFLEIRSLPFCTLLERVMDMSFA